jgi:hypothetical protein
VSLAGQYITPKSVETLKKMGLQLLDGLAVEDAAPVYYGYGTASSLQVRTAGERRAASASAPLRGLGALGLQPRAGAADGDVGTHRQVAFQISTRSDWVAAWNIKEAGLAFLAWRPSSSALSSSCQEPIEATQVERCA